MSLCLFVAVCLAWALALPSHGLRHSPLVRWLRRLGTLASDEPHSGVRSTLRINVVMALVVAVGYVVGSVLWFFTKLSPSNHWAGIL